MPTLTQVKVFPAIGIARLGNSPDYFIGPELPFPAPRPAPPGGFKDAQCQILHQAQRFRLFGYYDDGSVRELTAADGTITWTVHLANAKAASSEGVTIDPGPRTLTGPSGYATFSNGTYTYTPSGGGPTQSVEVPLGEMRTDDQARLIVCGGYGNSASPTNQPIVTFEGNPGWYDDVSDGPVSASIVVGATTFQALGAWVICPPPRYAPTVDSVISLYDTLRQAAIDAGTLPTPGQPSFVGDIWPILQRALNVRRVATFPSTGTNPHDVLSTVIPPGSGQDATRATIFSVLANPAGGGGNMPLLQQGGDPVAPTLRPFQYAQMKSWAANDFDATWPGTIPTLTPDGMTQAALENCVGAPFYPGIEATTTIRTFTYLEPFRLDPTTLSPGDVTKLMARPWQSDFNACQDGWWPAARPDTVFPEATPTVPSSWTRGLVTTAQDMVDNWYRLGFIVDTGTGNGLVETERHVVCKDCFLITDRSTFGKDEIAAMLHVATPAVIDAAFYVVVEGFAASDLGITTASFTAPASVAPVITLTPTIPGMTVAATALLAEDPSLPASPQRFTFVYQVVFTDTTGFTAEIVPVTLVASIGGVSGQGSIELTTQPDPFLVDGATSWLSTDLRVFQINADTSRFGVTMGSDPSIDPSTFIKAVLGVFQAAPPNPAPPAPPTHPFDSISTDQQTSRLELSQAVGGTAVFNFAVCRVRYRALATPAPNVRVFFRLFQTASTGTSYDPTTSYRRGGAPGVVIPLLGIEGGELVTIPCFADPRIDSSPAGPANGLDSQPDPANVQTIDPDATGAEHDTYFGCWLDINQPGQPQFPIQPNPADGPFPSGRKTIQDLIRGLHQCLVAEVAFDPDPIATGASPAQSDKLAQRNLAIVESDNPGSAASHRVQHTFDIRPTRTTLKPKEKPDELMIDWGNTPVGSVATVYLPSVKVAQVLQMAGRLYETTLLERVDDHTLRCRTGGVTYLPIPPGTGSGIAGLLTVDLPETVRYGQAFTIVVRQITTAPIAQPTVRQIQVRERALASERRPPPSARRILGAFQITVPVRHKEQMLDPERRWLSVLRSIQETIPPENRWSLVFTRYLRQIADRVGALGGDPGAVHPSPCGEWQGPHRDPDCEPRSEPGGLLGKIGRLIHDGAGKLEGFVLELASLEERVLTTHDVAIEAHVRDAHRDGVTVMVEVDEASPRRASAIVRRPP